MENLTIPELQEQMRAGQTTSRALAEGCLERIGSVNRQGPRLNAVIELNPDALAAAEALDRERAAGPGPRPAARHPGPDQRQYRHGRPHDDHRRLAGAGRLDPRRGMPSSSSGCARPGW